VLAADLVFVSLNASLTSTARVGLDATLATGGHAVRGQRLPDRQPPPGQRHRLAARLLVHTALEPAHVSTWLSDRS
jgi:hypothetical protein